MSEGVEKRASDDTVFALFLSSSGVPLRAHHVVPTSTHSRLKRETKGEKEGTWCSGTRAIKKKTKREDFAIL
jgi:hypothetical protein